ncbi:uncharacterized protein C8Q71DRAFT_789146 [Rhodofomes roseus]|uniref:Uncharacterized protein n=1 Tax=Rhodofomes roseus TaxID=34475 RepID=A0ABQ8JZZ2_9APHY|nr:uncharacterized protein C8Q71DRAFT_789146 [Rhodofomes roseus]KAH9829904.1 hypothetical protein C8Q71DRAFT_789146 [Rhodofomes roseus]
MARGSFGGARGRGRGSRFGTRGSSHYRGGRGRGRGRGRGGAPADAQPQREEDGTQLAERFEQVELNDEVDEKLGFARVLEGSRREGWLINMHPVSSPSEVLHRCSTPPYSFLCWLDPFTVTQGEALRRQLNDIPLPCFRSPYSFSEYDRGGSASVRVMMQFSPCPVLLSLSWN